MQTDILDQILDELERLNDNLDYYLSHIDLTLEEINNFIVNMDD